MPEAYSHQPKRVRILEVSPLFLLGIGSGKVEVTAHPLPDDAKFAGAWFDPHSGSFIVHVESAEFGPVPAGEWIPRIPAPAWRRLEG